MKGEINRDFYCSANAYTRDGHCRISEGAIREEADGDNICYRTTLCENCHRKYPTPEQFKEEYGEEYPDDAAIYVFDDNGFDDNGDKGFWNKLDLDTLRQEAGRYIDNEIVICACTPFGKPDDDWRPE